MLHICQVKFYWVGADYLGLNNAGSELYFN